MTALAAALVLALGQVPAGAEVGTPARIRPPAVAAGWTFGRIADAPFDGACLRLTTADFRFRTDEVGALRAAGTLELSRLVTREELIAFDFRAGVRLSGVVGPLRAGAELQIARQMMDRVHHGQMEGWALAGRASARLDLVRIEHLGLFAEAAWAISGGPRVSAVQLLLGLRAADD